MHVSRRTRFDGEKVGLTFRIACMANAILVLDVFDEPSDETLGSLGSSVDRDEIDRNS